MHPLVQAASAYGAVGGVVAAAFLLFGLECRMPEARASIAFRPLIVPGLILLWPLVLWRWAVPAGGAPRGVLRLRAHRAAWRVLALLLPLVVVGALVLRQIPASTLPVLLAAP